MNQNILSLIIFFSTFSIFVMEALFHYNIGKNGLRQFEMPLVKNFLKLVLVVMLFAFINTLFIRWLNNAFLK